MDQSQSHDHQLCAQAKELKTRFRWHTNTCDVEVTALLTASYSIAGGDSKRADVAHVVTPGKGVRGKAC